MAYEPDLATTGLFGIQAPVKSVGYLSREHDYPKGDVSDAVFDRMASLVLLHLLNTLGYHDCDLGFCASNRRQPELYWRGMRISRSSSSNILVPDKTVIYMAPQLILHYIKEHRYRPPGCFLEAVLNCPEPGSDEYRGAIKKVIPDLCERYGELLGC
jgi:hypothetical protein